MLADVTNIAIVREQHAKTKTAKAAALSDPIPLGTPEEVRAFLGRVAGELMDEKPSGWASAAASIAGAALKSMGVESIEDEEGEESDSPRSFAYQTTEGVPVTVAGRDG